MACKEGGMGVAEERLGSVGSSAFAGRAAIALVSIAWLSGCREPEVTTLPPTVSSLASRDDAGAPPPPSTALPEQVPPRPTFRQVDSTEAATLAATLRDECFDVAETLLASAPADPAGWTLLGAVHQRYGDGAGALALWNRAVELAPDSAETHRHLGDAAVGGHDLVEAIRQYRLALERDPESNALVGKLADTLLRSGDTVAAADLLLVFLAGRPRAPEAWCLLGKTRLIEGKIEAARRAFQRALDVDPTSRDARRGMGLALERLGQSEPKSVSFELTEQLQDRREQSRPSRRIEEAEAAGPRPWTATVNYWAAVSHARLGNATRAAMGWRRALELDNDDNDSREALADLYAGTGRTREAMKLRQEWCKREPANPAAWFGMGKLALGLGLQEEAAAALRTVVALAPERAEGHALLSRAVARLDPEASLGAARKAAELDPSAAHWAILGEALDRDGKTEEAIPALERALALDPDDARARAAYERIRSRK